MHFAEADENTYSSGNAVFGTVPPDPENPYARLIPDQTIVSVPSFTLESGVILWNVPVAFKTYGKLSPQRDNAMVICHALTGSADVGDWWGPMLGGSGKAFDTSKFFVICFNSLGSPYGSASPVTSKDGIPGRGQYGPEFPLTTVRDDVKCVPGPDFLAMFANISVRLFKAVLDDLGVRQIATVVGGSMGGMLVLEFAYFGKDYVRTIVPMATSARYSAWGISWNEAQRQSLYSDPKYDNGYYSFDDPPVAGLAAARMSALLTYRSRDSFETRFGRNVPDPSSQRNINSPQISAVLRNEHWAIHNEGNKNAKVPKAFGRNDGITTSDMSTKSSVITDPQFNGTTALAVPPSKLSSQARKTPTYFSAQSYLRYQGEKFIKRFDANCYIAITRKLDTHDVSRNRNTSDVASSQTVNEALKQIEQPTLILGIESDGLFTFAEQEELAEAIPNSTLKTIDSAEGHDAFLLEFEQVNRLVIHFLNQELSHIMNRKSVESNSNSVSNGVACVTKSSIFGEVEVGDITAW